MQHFLFYATFFCISGYLQKSVTKSATTYDIIPGYQVLWAKEHILKYTITALWRIVLYFTRMIAE